MEDQSTNTTPQPPVDEHNTSPQDPQIVHISRSVSPVKQPVSDEVKAKHEQSVRKYPNLNLSEGEYVISAVRRHWIGLVAPISLAVFMTGLIMSSVLNYPLIMASLGIVTGSEYGLVILCGVLISFLFLLGTYIAISVYSDNRFFLTNESAIQEIRHSLFSKSEQTVSLANIEDASYQQHGILQSMLDYGSIRLSTEGDETTYRFSYVANPKREIALLNNAVESFKNGRPIEE